MRALLIGLAASIVLTGAAAAHAAKAAVTEILFNDRTGNIEVAHRFSLHDAEHAVLKRTGVRPDLISDAAAREAFAVYVTERFEIETQTGEAMALTLLGAEIEEGYIWVYEEATDGGALQGLSIRHDALRDIWPEQSNLVNISRGGVIQSVVFDGAAQFQAVGFAD